MARKLWLFNYRVINEFAIEMYEVILHLLNAYFNMGSRNIERS